MGAIRNEKLEWVCRGDKILQKSKMSGQRSRFPRRKSEISGENKENYPPAEPVALRAEISRGAAF